MEALSSDYCQPYCNATKAFETLVLDIDALDGPLNRIESAIQDKSREVMRLLLEEKLGNMSEPSDSLGIKGADGLVRTHKRTRTKTIRTIFGPVQHSRAIYSTKTRSEIGGLAPQDSALNLPESSYSNSRHVNGLNHTYNP